MSVIDANEEFETRRMVAIFAKLTNLADKASAELLANPAPHLASAAAEIIRLREAIETAKHQLSGIDTARWSDSDMTAPINIGAEALRRNKLAWQTLSDASDYSP